LEEIVTAVKRVTDIITEITAAGQEQSQGIGQVNQAVTQMDQVVQETAAQTEELSSTAKALATQAAQLQGVVGRFKFVRDGYLPPHARGICMFELALLSPAAQLATPTRISRSSNLASPSSIGMIDPAGPCELCKRDMEEFQVLIRQPSIALTACSTTWEESSEDDVHRPCAVASRHRDFRSGIYPISGTHSRADRDRTQRS
jgi:hypothetical protein